MKSFLIGTVWFSSLLLPIQAIAKEPKVDIRTAGNYVVLAKTGIATIPTSVVTGDIAVSPAAATYLTGFSLSLDAGGESMTDGTNQVIGKAFGADNGIVTPGVLGAAVLDMEAAYTDAMGRVNTDDARKNPGGGAGGVLGGAEFGGENAKLTPGVYTFNTAVSIAGDVYFEGTGTGVGQGDTDVFIIQTTGVLTQLADTTVILSNGALAENVIWVVAGNAAVGVGAHMAGIFLIKTNVAFAKQSSLNGRILSQTETALDGATIGVTAVTAAPTLEECVTDTGVTGSTICPDTDVVTMYVGVESNALPIDLDILFDLEFTGTETAPTVDFKVNNPFGSNADIYVQLHRDMGEKAGSFEEECDGQMSIGACNPTTAITAACLVPPGQTPYAIVTVFFVSNDIFLGDGGGEVDKCCHQEASTIGTPVVEYSFAIHCGCPADFSRNLRGNSKA
jgi:hypothetical protein